MTTDSDHAIIEPTLSLAWAKNADERYASTTKRELFHIPKHQGEDCIYFCGNSLGLQPKSVEKFVLEELEDWKNLGVEGHFHARRPWFGYHKFLAPATARLVGALPHEVVVMNNLTVNLHLLLISFYKPSFKQYKVIMEAGAFPSDQYALESQVCMHDLDPEECIIELAPRTGEHTLRKEDILSAIETHGAETALIMMGGVNYYTGQWYPMKEISEAARKFGIRVGFDLAHAAGNVPLQLHDWDVDFACWCSYKYLNSGPGGSSGVFIHERHAQNTSLHRLAGWWGHDEGERFKMKKGFKPMPTAEGWQLSNAQILSMAAHLASLELFDEVGMTPLREKSLALTAFAEKLVREINHELKDPSSEDLIHIITPSDPEDRGCQLSLVIPEIGKSVFEFLSQQGVVADWREPDVIRIAPVPLYNTFEEVWRFGEILRKGILSVKR